MYVHFPLEFQIFESAAELGTVLNSLLSNGKDKCFIVSGEKNSYKYATFLRTEFEIVSDGVYSITDNEMGNLYNFESKLRTSASSYILSVGGGKVGDFAKRLSLISNVPLILVPTSISNDGLISPVSVLRDQGKSTSLPGKMPDAVLLDLQILRSAPKRFLHAAACDLVTNLSATNDWLSSEGSSKNEHNLGIQLAQIAANSVLNSYTWDLDDDTFLRSVISGQVLSGIAMAVAGNSRPCSGGEHLISHALDFLELGGDMLHGEKVAACSRFCLYLQNFSTNRLGKFFEHFNIKKILPGTEKFDNANLAELFAKAKTMRPNRKTVLDNYSNQELADLYLKYLSY